MSLFEDVFAGGYVFMWMCFTNATRKAWCAAAQPLFLMLSYYQCWWGSAHGLSEAVRSTLSGVAEESEMYFVVSWSLSGAYILLSWIESLTSVLSGGETCHIKPTSFTYTYVCLVVSFLCTALNPGAWPLVWQTYRTLEIRIIYKLLWYDLVFGVFFKPCYRQWFVEGKVSTSRPVWNSSKSIELIAIEMCADINVSQRTKPAGIVDNLSTCTSSW